MAACPGIFSPGIHGFCEPVIALEVVLNLRLKSSTSNQKDKFSSQKFVRRNSWNMDCKAGSSSYFPLLSCALDDQEYGSDQVELQFASGCVVRQLMNHFCHTDHCRGLSFRGTTFLVFESWRSMHLVNRAGRCALVSYPTAKHDSPLL